MQIHSSIGFSGNEEDDCILWTHFPYKSCAWLQNFANMSTHYVNITVNEDFFMWFELEWIDPHPPTSHFCSRGLTNQRRKLTSAILPIMFVYINFGW